MTKDEYIGRYLDKKSKEFNKLSYGMAYYALLFKHSELAGRKWERIIDNILNKKA